MSTMTSPIRYYWLADRTTRWLAKMIDSAMFIIALTPSYFAGTQDVNETLHGIVLLSGLLLLWGAQGYLLLLYGQTIGKKLMRIRIVSAATDEHPNWVKLLLLRGPVAFLLSVVPLVGQLFAIANTFFIFREDRRCIHDLIAGTKVVNDWAD